MRKHMSLSHFLSHLFVLPEPDLLHDTLSYTAQYTLLSPLTFISQFIYTILAVSSIANNLFWVYIVSTEVTHFHCIRQDINYKWLIFAGLRTCESQLINLSDIFRLKSRGKNLGFMTSCQLEMSQPVVLPLHHQFSVLRIARNNHCESSAIDNFHFSYIISHFFSGFTILEAQR